MKEKIKNVLALILLVLLLPYVITVFMSGKLMQTYLMPGNEGTYLSVEIDGKVREIAFEDYVAGVTALQIPAGYEQEALNAQMIIVRTELERKQEQEPDKLLSEKYLTMDKIDELGLSDRIMKAQKETKGKVITYNGKLIMPSYHAISSGRTREGNDVFESPDYTYLSSVDSKTDVEAKRYLHVEVYTPEEILAVLSTQYPQLQTEDKENPVPVTAENLGENMEIQKKDSSGYVLEVRVGNTVIPGEEFRNLLNLNSSCFTMEHIGDGFRITTKGLGHGMGLSQYGAQQMAKSGKTCSEIISYYYKDIKIEEREKETTSETSGDEITEITTGTESEAVSEAVSETQVK